MGVSLQKWHGAGNDFLVDVREGHESPWTPAEAAAVCNRTHGVGADGLLVATLGTPVEMFLYNSDGSTAEMSGNGIRCLVAAVRRATGAEWDQITVKTLAGTREVSLQMTGDVGMSSVAMGAVRLQAALPGSLGVANIGNPHVVVWDDPALSELELQDSALKFSNAVGGANVEFVTVNSRGELSVRAFERGAGWTQACGTGSCATVAVLNSLGLCDDTVIVNNPGGQLSVTLNGFEAVLSGPVQFVADVEWIGA
jgi:diaminopimelate epimerase